MGKSKFFAVKAGRRVGVFQGGWDEFRAYVDGYSGAVFKSFRTEVEANAFLGNTTSTSLPTHVTVSTDQIRRSEPPVIGSKRSLSEVQAPSESSNHPKCNCGNKTVLRTVTKENANKGREFFSCRNFKCKFFEFKDGKRSLVTATVNKHIPITSETVLIYTDGSCVGNYQVKQKIHPAGWGIVVITRGDGRRDASAELIDERYGPVELHPESEEYLGATVTSNNTAELSAIGQALKYVIEKYSPTLEIPHIVIRYDSEYAASSIVGLYNGNDCNLLITS